MYGVSEGTTACKCSSYSPKMPDRYNSNALLIFTIYISTFLLQERVLHFHVKHFFTTHSQKNDSGISPSLIFRKEIKMFQVHLKMAFTLCLKMKWKQSSR